MVLDNADDLEVFFGNEGEISFQTDKRIARFLPENENGKFLVTTRDLRAGTKLAKEGPLIHVNRMAESEDVELLRMQLRGLKVTDDELSTLSSELEGLPLALAQAAAFMKERSCSVQDYLEVLTESDQNFVDLLSQEFETVGRDSGTPRAVAITWMISFQQIQRQNALASDFLSFMSMLDRQGVPKKLLLRYRACSSLESLKAIGVLKAFSLVVEDKSEGFNMHRLVHVVTRKWLVREGLMESFHKDALTSVLEVFPWGGVERNPALCSTYLPHAQAVLRLDEHAEKERGDKKKTRALGELLLNIAEYHASLREWKEAEELVKEGLSKTQRVLGADDAATLNLMGALISIYAGSGHYEKAKDLIEVILKAIRTDPGADHSKIRAGIFNPLVYRGDGLPWEEVEKFLIDAIAKCKAQIGVDHPFTLGTLRHLASICSSLHRWDEAGKVFAELMAVKKAKYGIDHSETLSAMFDLASVYGSQNRLDEAEKLTIEFIKLCKTKLEVDDFQTQSGWDMLSWIYRRQGNMARAEKLSVELTAARKAKFGEDSFYTIISMATLAATNGDQGQWEKGEKLAVEALGKSKENFGEAFFLTTYIVTILAMMYMNQGRWEEAGKLEVEAMKAQKTRLGPSHPTTAQSMKRVACIRWREGKGAEATELMRECIRFYEGTVGSSHPDTQKCLEDLKGMLE